ncbi:MAG: OadG family transporter subunit [Lachnospiraceae bacterium]|nr:OadG family transporter subunit [Lachnospiraceae bacterium]MDY5701633.1 OadG family transporter subunit [Lachnospiraceae bacterium]
MKKFLLVLGMITCIFGLTACQKEEVITENYGVTEEQAAEYGKGLIETINDIVLYQEMEQYASEEVIYAALENYASALKDMGDYQSVDRYTVTYDDGIIIDLEVSGSLRNATVQIILDEELLLVGISTNVVYSFGEMMAKAGLNTLMGMGTVFMVLILISLLISSFSLISSFQKKKDKKAQNSVAAADKAIEQIIEKEELNDNLELAAVIAAAVAAYEGAASSDGYVVRSIKRRNR